MSGLFIMFQSLIIHPGLKIPVEKYCQNKTVVVNRSVLAFADHTDFSDLATYLYVYVKQKQEPIKDEIVYLKLNDVRKHPTFSNVSIYLYTHIHMYVHCTHARKCR